MIQQSNEPTGTGPNSVVKKVTDHTVEPLDHGIRALRYFKNHFRQLYGSGRDIHQSFKRGEVTVNGEIVPETKILKAGDTINATLDCLKAQKDRYQNVGFDVAWEDPLLAVVAKSPGISVQPMQLAAPVVLTHCVVDPELLQHRVWAVNRLEKSAYGLVLVAKTLECYLQLQKQYQQGQITEMYTLICHGDLRPLLPQLEKKFETVEIIASTRSNAAGFLTTVVVSPRTPWGGVYVRRELLKLGCPVVGSAGFTRQLRSNSGKGLCLALTELRFQHPSNPDCIVHITRPVPVKFQAILQREEQFFQEKAQNFFKELARHQTSACPTTSHDSLDQMANHYDHTQQKPLAYLTGEKDFGELQFRVTPDTLIPRTSSITLVHSVVELIQTRMIEPQLPLPRMPSPSDEPASNADPEADPSNQMTPVLSTSPTIHVLDIGTGCGCLLLSILHHCPATGGLGVDISGKALDVAKLNAERHHLSSRVTWLEDDMSQLANTRSAYLTTHHPFDIIVCNPPYLCEVTGARRINSVSRQYEPTEALFAGQRGYHYYYLLAELMRSTQYAVLRSGGFLVLEVGNGMADKVKEILQSVVIYTGSVRDTQGMERCLIFQR
ncbi:hypothetical protein IWQ62_000495 [Dispira parvispora]|uniref:S-adenosyl-L-methionine-dependent methyltransferase n=1 Tax=Dispira parvispora TaxID=1520584 RepID=A0A9W8AY94_9FUNG|nr:hypothetical protein IWQ62_000495 [Dispira parvispora]